MSVRHSEVEVEWVPLASLKAYDGNAKKHDNANIEAIANSIQEFGFRNPILAWHNEDGVAEIVAGHGRAAAAKKLQLENVPVVFVDDLSDAQRRMLTHADNQTTLMTGWDGAQLAEELDALMDAFDVGMFGFHDADGAQHDVYVDKVSGLIYEPSGKEVAIEELADKAEADALAEWVRADDDLSDDVKSFCELAAMRFVKFDYEAIAEYYAMAPEPTKRAFEALKLVIIDDGGVLEEAAVEYIDVLERQ